MFVLCYISDIFIVFLSEGVCNYEIDKFMVFISLIDGRFNIIVMD